MGKKNNICEDPGQGESVELKKEKLKVLWLQLQEESLELEKEMVKVPWLQVQEKMQIRTDKDAGLTNIEKRRLLNAIVEEDVSCIELPVGCIEESIEDPNGTVGRPKNGSKSPGSGD